MRLLPLAYLMFYFILVILAAAVNLGNHAPSEGTSIRESSVAPPTFPAIAASTDPIGPTQPSAFFKKQFDGGISVELPTNWRWMDASDAASLNTSSEAVADSVGFEVNQGNNTILLAGNAFNDDKQSVATLRVSLRSSALGSQADMREGLKDPQRDVEAAMLIELETTAAAMRKLPTTRYYRVVGGSFKQNPSLICIWSGFESDVGRGATVSDLWVCPLGKRALKLSASYHKDRANLFAPIIAYVWRSLSATSN